MTSSILKQGIINKKLGLMPLISLFISTLAFAHSPKDGKVYSFLTSEGSLAYGVVSKKESNNSIQLIFMKNGSSQVWNKSISLQQATPIQAKSDEKETKVFTDAVKDYYDLLQIYVNANKMSEKESARALENLNLISKMSRGKIYSYPKTFFSPDFVAIIEALPEAKSVKVVYSRDGGKRIEMETVSVSKLTPLREEDETKQAIETYYTFLKNYDAADKVATEAKDLTEVKKALKTFEDTYRRKLYFVRRSNGGYSIGRTVTINDFNSSEETYDLGKIDVDYAIFDKASREIKFRCGSKFSKAEEVLVNDENKAAYNMIYDILTEFRDNPKLLTDENKMQLMEAIQHWSILK